MNPFDYPRQRFCVLTDDVPIYITGIDPPGINPPSAIRFFNTAGLRPLLQENISKYGFRAPTRLQKRCMPIIMSGRDLLCCAHKGSGKTAAFLLPILNKLMEGLGDNHGGEVNQAENHAGEMVQAPQCLVITPTRELAMQLKDEAQKLSMGSTISEGIVAHGDQLQIQKGCNFLITTPGRLIDFVDKSKVSFENLKYLVLDEADRMFDMGFMPDIQRIMDTSSMPAKEERQTLIFSDTFSDTFPDLPSQIQTTAKFLSESYLFVTVTVGVIRGPFANIAQEFFAVTKYEKKEKLKQLMQSCDPKDKTLVFVRTKKNADIIATHLSGEGLPTTSIHGDMFQREQEEVLDSFRTGAFPILVATSEAARDIKGVAHIVNFDMPEDIAEYGHRIRKTGSIGNIGKATSFYDDKENRGIAGPLVKILSECVRAVPDWLAEAASNVPADGEKSKGGDIAAAYGNSV